MLRPSLLATSALLLAGPTLAQSFTDQTAASGINHTYVPGAFSNRTYCGGGAAGDFDGDGDQDLFLLSGKSSGNPDALYLNSGSGTFVNAAAAWGLTLVHDGKGAATADYDDDGDLDVYATSAGSGASGSPGNHKLFRNTGSSFVEVAASAGVNQTTTTTEDGFGAAFGDHDLDGDLDLFVAGFANLNAGSRLFRNDGDGTFTDVTEAIGFWSGTGISVRAFAPRFADMDGDAYPELLLASDFGTSRYFRNDGDGTFTDITVAAGVGLDENGMGHTVGDFDGNGLLDWYVTSIYLPQASWTGNKLYLNQGNHTYTEVSKTAGVFDGGYGWGAVAVDFDHNGWQDIAETNGGSSGVGVFANQQSYLWMNAGGFPFSEVAQSVGLVHNGEGRAMLDLDVDGDGDSDVVIVGNQEPTFLFRNETVPPGPAPAAGSAHWLRVFLDTTDDPSLAPGGYGAVVSATTGATTQKRWVTGGDNLLGQSELSAHFGLGSSATIDLLEVEWSNGLVTSLTNVPADQILTLSPPTPWVDLGSGLAGTFGVPQLTPKSPLLLNKPFVLDLSDTLAGTVGAHGVGFSALNLPLFGGTMVPSPDYVFSFTSDAGGTDSFATTWPLGVPGLQVWVQSWVLDPAGVQGFASTNGFVGTTN